MPQLPLMSFMNACPDIKSNITPKNPWWRMVAPYIIRNADVTQVVKTRAHVMALLCMSRRCFVHLHYIVNVMLGCSQSFVIACTPWICAGLLFTEQRLVPCSPCPQVTALLSTGCSLDSAHFTLCCTIPAICLSVLFTTINGHQRLLIL